MTTPHLASVMPSPSRRWIAPSPSIPVPWASRSAFATAPVSPSFARDAVELGLITPIVAGIPAGHGRCYCKLSGGIDTIYSDYRERHVTIRHELRDESYGMREFMIADPDGNELNFGQSIA